MKFVNLNSRLDSIDRRSTRNSYRRSSSNVKKTLIKLGVFAIIVFLLIYLPARGIYASGKEFVRKGRDFSSALENQNLDGMKSAVKGVRDASSSLNTSLNFLIWIRVLPFLGGYYSDVKHFAKAANYELEAVEVLVSSLDPYKVELGFTGQATPGQDKIAQLVKILDKVNPQLNGVAPLLKQASMEVEGIDVAKYPEKLGKYRLKSLVETAKNFIVGANFAVTQAKDAIDELPNALGQPNTKTYLIIFQNDKEIRATGGFMTAYAFMKLDKGHVSTSTSDDIYRLDERLLGVCRTKICPLSPPGPIVKYLPEANGKPRSAWSMRDSNLSPDVPTSLKELERMYSYLGNGEPFDGIILIDSHVVEELIKITGSVEVFGTTYSADKDPRCNCPNVIYELENYAQIIEKGEKDRKAILGTLMQQILARALGSSTESLPELINAAVKLANAKDIIFYMHDQKMQNALSKLNWTGEINPSADSGRESGDYLHINDSNFAGGKSNLYVNQNVTLDVRVDSSGKVKNMLVVKYSNPQKYNIWLNGINRDYVRVYVPQGSKLISSKGSEVEVTTIKEELGKTVFEAFIQVRPQNSTALSFEYELPGEFKGKEYSLLIQKQPGAKHFEYTVKVNGKTKEKFELNADKGLMINL